MNAGSNAYIRAMWANSRNLKECGQPTGVGAAPTMQAVAIMRAKPSVG